MATLPARFGAILLVSSSLMLAACADRMPARDPTVGEVSSSALIGIGAAAFLGGPLGVGAAAAAGTTFIDPDTRVSELVSGGHYRHRPRVCATLRDCVFSGTQ